MASSLIKLFLEMFNHRFLGSGILFGCLVCVVNCESVYRKVSNPVPIVLWHGMGDTCCNFLSLGSFTKFLKTHIPDVYVHSISIGDSFAQDMENGYFGNGMSEVEYACNVLQKDPNLKDGYNAIGFSQGGLFMRALAQTCPNPPMQNLISFGGPQQGVFGFPRCPGDNSTICDEIRKLLNIGAYVGFVQNHLIQAQYWHDPLQEDEYVDRSIFLATVNNEKHQQDTYRTNLLKLSNLILVKFNQDTMVTPKESEWFGFYSPGQEKNILSMQDTTLYMEDRIGIKELDESTRLKLLSIDGDHLQIPNQWLVDNIIRPYLA